MVEKNLPSFCRISIVKGLCIWLNRLLRLITAIRALQIVHAGSDKQYVTVSIGLATVVPSSQETLRSLVLSADRALYAAKALGRNCYYTA